MPSPLLAARQWSIKPPLGAQVNATSPLANGLTSFWLLAEGGGSTAFAYPASVSGSPTGTHASIGAAAGETGLVLTSNTNNSGLSSTTGPTPTGPWSIFVRFYLTDATVASFQRGVAGYPVHANGSGEWGLQLRAASGSSGASVLSAEVYLGGTLKQAKVTANTLSAGVWYTAIGTWDGATLRLYQNGVQTASTSASGSLAAASKFTVGYSPDNGTGDTGLKGSISVVGTWSRALTAAEAQQLSVAPYALMVAPLRGLLVASSSAAIALTLTEATTTSGSAGTLTAHVPLTVTAAAVTTGSAGTLHAQVALAVTQAATTTGSAGTLAAHVALTVTEATATSGSAGTLAGHVPLTLAQATATTGSSGALSGHVSLAVTEATATTGSTGTLSAHVPLTTTLGTVTTSSTGLLAGLVPLTLATATVTTGSAGTLSAAGAYALVITTAQVQSGTTGALSVGRVPLTLAPGATVSGTAGLLRGLVVLALTAGTVTTGSAGQVVSRTTVPDNTDYQMTAISTGDWSATSITTADYSSTTVTTLDTQRT